CTDCGVGLDSVLAYDSRCASHCDCVARKVSEGTAFIVDSTPWVAFLGGLFGPRLASRIARDRVLVPFHREALVEECFPENIARWQSGWRDQVVSQRGLFAGRETRDVFGRVPAILFARPGLDCGVAHSYLDLAIDHSRGPVWGSRPCSFAVGESYNGRGFWR